MTEQVISNEIEFLEPFSQPKRGRRTLLISPITIVNSANALWLWSAAQRISPDADAPLAVQLGRSTELVRWVRDVEELAAPTPPDAGLQDVDGAAQYCSFWHRW